MNENTPLIERIAQLEQQVKELQIALYKINTETSEKYIAPTSFGGGQDERITVKPVDIKTGLGRKLGSSLIWHTGELQNPPVNEEAPNPESIDGAKGYNKHSHSRFSGGALEKSTLEIQELDLTTQNKHSQQYWQEEPTLKSDLNLNGEKVDRIGNLDLIFNPDTKKWGSTCYEIDVKKCYLVIRDSDGNIMLDSKGQEMKSLLYQEDQTKTSIIWDEDGGCWRLFSVYASGS
jgi:hypothetical protein